MLQRRAAVRTTWYRMQTRVLVNAPMMHRTFLKKPAFVASPDILLLKVRAKRLTAAAAPPTTIVTSMINNVGLTAILWGGIVPLESVMRIFVPKRKHSNPFLLSLVAIVTVVLRRKMTKQLVSAFMKIEIIFGIVI